MKNKIILAVVIGALSLNIYARVWHDGNLTVILSDTEGRPITNATVTVKTSKDILWGRGCDDEYNFISANSDSNGVASVDFRFCDPDFTWRLKTPSHYSQRYFPSREWFRANVVPSDYCNIDTNTVEGVARYNELLGVGEIDNYDSFTNFVAKFEPKSVTYTNRRIERTLRFYPKRNPQPMYAYGKRDDIPLPRGRNEVPTNGYTVVVYPRAKVDLKNNKAVRSDEPIGVDGDADFSIEQYMIETNGVYEVVVRFKFADGCGAYKAKRAMDDSFPTLYAADTNAEFVAEYEFSTISDSATDELISQKRLLNDDECLVLRTRMSLTEDGMTNGWHYSKIFGPICVGPSFSFRQTVFNPRLNDPNLELDMDRNLAGRKYDVCWP